jgi:hypothetical protein
MSSKVQATEPVYDEPVDIYQNDDQFVDRYADDSTASLLDGLYQDNDGPLFIPNPGDRNVPGVSEYPEVTETPEVSVVPEVTETPEVPAVPEVAEIPEVPAVPEETEIPEVPTVPEVTEIPEAPAVPEVTEIPEVPTVPELSEIPDVPSRLSVDDLLPVGTPAASELVATVTADKLALILVDDDKVKQSLEQVSLFFVDGQMGTVNELSEKFKDIGTLCLFSTTGDSSSLAETIQKDVVLQGSSKEQEPDSKGNTTLELKFSDGTLKLFCIKNNTSDFTFGDLRTALNGIVELRVRR